MTSKVNNFTDQKSIITLSVRTLRGRKNMDLTKRIKKVKNKKYLDLLGKKCFVSFFCIEYFFSVLVNTLILLTKQSRSEININIENYCNFWLNFSNFLICKILLTQTLKNAALFLA